MEDVDRSQQTAQRSILEKHNSNKWNERNVAQINSGFTQNVGRNKSTKFLMH